MKSVRLACGLALAVALSVTASAGDAESPKIEYRLEAVAGKPATGDELRSAVAVMERRFSGAGLAGINVTASADTSRITLRFPEELVPQIDAIAKLVERPGTLEFRMVATSEAETLRQLKAIGHERNPSPECSWVACANGDPDELVEKPEQPFAAEVDALRAKGVAEDAPELKAACTHHDDAVRDNVFTGDQIARAGVVFVRKQVLVSFEFKEDRKAAFAAFTEKNVRRRMAIILDGKVDSVTVLMAKLPGEGRISGGGDNGFTEREARDLTAVLASGAIPGRLVRVTAPEKK